MENTRFETAEEFFNHYPAYFELITRDVDTNLRIMLSKERPFISGNFTTLIQYDGFTCDAHISWLSDGEKTQYTKPEIVRIRKAPPLWEQNEI